MQDHYEPFLDSVRGIMAMWVFIYHASVACGFFSPFIPPGAIAVDVFMFLSGFLMTRNFLIREDREPLASGRTIRNFWMRRFFRIAPVYYLLLIFAYALAQDLSHMWKEIEQIFPPPWISDLANDPSQRELTALNIFTHLSFVFGLFPQYSSNDPLPDWSLSLEMQFYLLLPFMMLIARRTGFVILALLCIAVETLAVSHIGLYHTPINTWLYPQPSLIIFKIDCFMVGILMAVYFAKRSLLTLSVMIILMFHGQYTLFVLATLFCFVALGAERATKSDKLMMSLKDILSCNVGRFFGDISYSVYLVHALVFLPVLYLLAKSEKYVAAPASLRFALLLCLSAPIVISTAFLLHRFVEQPGIRLGRHFTSKTFRPRALPETP